VPECCTGARATFVDGMAQSPRVEEIAARDFVSVDCERVGSEVGRQRFRHRRVSESGLGPTGRWYQGSLKVGCSLRRGLRAPEGAPGRFRSRPPAAGWTEGHQGLQEAATGPEVPRRVDVSGATRRPFLEPVAPG